MESESKIFFDSKKWQRFVHFIYINDMTECLYSENCDVNVINQALRYATLNKYHAKVNGPTNVINPLKKNYLDIFKSNIDTLNSLKEQNGETIEKTLAEFNAPLLHKRLTIWMSIFQKWKEMYIDKKNAFHNVICDNVQAILNEGKKSISISVLNLGLENPNAEIHKMLYNSFQCKHRDDVRLLLKHIILEEELPICPYERGNPKYLFLTDKAIKQYSDTWNIVPARLNRVRKSTDVKPLENMPNTEPQRQIITDALEEQNSLIFKNDNTATNFLDFTNLSLSHSSKRKMIYSTPMQDENESGIYKRKKLYFSNEFLPSIASDESHNSFDGDTYSRKKFCSGRYFEDQTDINNNREAILMRSELQTAKTLIDSLNKERKSLLMQIKKCDQELQDQKNLCNQDITRMRLELETAYEKIRELTTENDNRLEELIKLRDELQNEETLKVLGELRLRSEIERAEKHISDLTNDKNKMFIQINVLEKELQKIKARVEKVHQGRIAEQKSKKCCRMCCII